MKRSNKNARQVSNALWLSKARKFAENYAKEHTFVTSDNVVQGVGRAKTINATGALFRNGMFESVGYTSSTRPEAHGREIRIWKLR